MKRLIIVHGYTGYPDKNWFPWLKSEMEKRGIQVLVPAMPNTNEPVLDEWLPYLQATVGQPDEDTYLVGHSLGCATILRYLESLPDRQKVGGVVLVAGFAEPIHLTELNSFTEGAWNDNLIHQAARTIVLINSTNDPHVPLAVGERMHDRFGARLIVLDDAGHINEKSGFIELPIALDELVSMMGIKE